MAESLVQVSEGSGKKLHTDQKTIGANNVEDEYVLMGEPFLAGYQVSCTATSVATAASHVLTVNAGASLNLYIRRIMVFQVGLATTAAFCEWDLFRTTTAAPTGGTSFIPTPWQQGGLGSGATAMTLPTVKATEGNIMGRYSSYFLQTAGASTQFVQPMLDINFDQNRSRSLHVSSGTTNGIALKNVTAIAAATVRVNIWFTEANF